MAENVNQVHHILSTFRRTHVYAHYIDTFTFALMHIQKNTEIKHITYVYMFIHTATPCKVSCKKSTYNELTLLVCTKTSQWCRECLLHRLKCNFYASIKKVAECSTLNKKFITTHSMPWEHHEKGV